MYALSNGDIFNFQSLDYSNRKLIFLDKTVIFIADSDYTQEGKSFLYFCVLCATWFIYRIFGDFL